MINNPLLALGFEPTTFQLGSFRPLYKDALVSYEIIFPSITKVTSGGPLLVPKRVYVQLSSCSTASLTARSNQDHLASKIFRKKEILNFINLIVLLAVEL